MPETSIDRNRKLLMQGKTKFGSSLHLMKKNSNLKLISSPEDKSEHFSVKESDDESDANSVDPGSN